RKILILTLAFSFAFLLTGCKEEETDTLSYYDYLRPTCGDGSCNEREMTTGLCPEDCDYSMYDDQLRDDQFPMTDDQLVLVDDEDYLALKMDLKERSTEIYLPSASTGSDKDALAVRITLPKEGNNRYEEGAPIVVYGTGGYVANGLSNNHFPHMDDMIVVSMIFPGGTDDKEGRFSDGTYDYRGVKSVEALKDVILFAAGKKMDKQGKYITDYAPDALTDNIGFIGFSFGGNIGVAVAAIEGDEIADDLKYIVQWETPVSSQIATRDLGRMLGQPLEKGVIGRAHYFNPRYIAYDPYVIKVDYSDVIYDADSLFTVFHDGNGDGIYTTINGSYYNFPVPDLNDNNIIETDEDFGLDIYPYDTFDTDGKVVYSRPVTYALRDNGAFDGDWPAIIATVEEADEYWDVRESVALYEDAIKNIPDLEGMYLLSMDDHVQSDPHKSHVHQAYDGWNDAAWFKINPDPEYILEWDSSFADLDIPNLPPNTAPDSWEDADSYCIPEDIDDEIYSIAAVHQMADRVQEAN
ncbi:hypothetical protein KJ742_06305, partial [Patescibacteria group bacterium]|nr:hypothetical protein [Patescibacteria group bacterium]